MHSFKPRLENLEDRLVPTNILFFGNSYTDAGNPITFLPTLVREIAVAAGRDAPGIASRNPPGYRLDQHAADQTPATIRNLLSAADYVVFQGQSQQTWKSYFGSAIVNQFIQGTLDLGADVRAAYPNAKIVMLETWARPAPLADVYPTPYANPGAMQAEILQGYSSAVSALEGRYGTQAADMAPAGEAFKHLGFANGLYADSGGHPSTQGALVAALTIYGAIYDDNTSDIPVARAVALLQSRGLNAAQWIQATRAADMANGQYDSARNRAYIEKLYQDLLGRSADAAGLKQIHFQITTGALNRAQVADVFLHSDEFYSKSIGAEYQRILGRDADAGGMAVFMNYLRSGVSLDGVRQVMFESDEFLVRSGGTNVGFVEQLYRSYFNRAADANAWVAALDAKATTRAAVIAGFTSSPENRINQVSALYRTILVRPADPAGRAFYSNRLNAGIRVQDIMRDLIASEEYYSAFG